MDFRPLDAAIRVLVVLALTGVGAMISVLLALTGITSWTLLLPPAIWGALGIAVAARI